MREERERSFATYNLVEKLPSCHILQYKVDVAFTSHNLIKLDDVRMLHNLHRGYLSFDLHRTSFQGDGKKQRKKKGYTLWDATQAGRQEGRKEGIIYIYIYI